MKHISISLIIISGILSLCFTIFLLSGSEPIQYALDDRPNSQDYEELKTLANNIAKSASTEVIKNDDIITKTTFTDEFFIIELDNSICSIKATYPVTTKTSINNNEITKIIHIDYDNVVYQKASNIHPTWIYFAVGLGFLIMLSILIFIILYIIYLMYELIVVTIECIIMKLKRN